MTPDDHAIIADALRRLTRDGQLVLEQLAQLVEANSEARPAQRVAASKMILEYTLGKPSAASSKGAVGRPGAATTASTPGFDLSRLDRETARRYLEALQTIEEIETQALGSEGDGSEG